MRRAINLTGLILLVAISAGAQGPAGVGTTTPQGRPHKFSAPELTNWQFSLGYQYNRINLIGTPFTTNGLNASIARYFGRWLGVEGQLGIGFGNTGSTTTPANLSAQSLFVGGGPRLAYRGHGRLEPWLHVVVGMEHFRFTQTAGVLGSNTALAGAGGGGVDYILGQHTAVRVEADEMMSRFFSTNQRHFQIAGGLVFNF
jgi:hypothetical protein